jgi:hypothetical protein
MTMLSLAPALSTLGFGVFLVLLSTQERSPGWKWPAGLAVVFCVGTLWTVMREGLFGFWYDSTQSLWDNQIWVDLVLAFGISLAALAPMARAQGLRIWPWALLTLCSGSIGILALYARILYLRDRKPAVVTA